MDFAKKHSTAIAGAVLVIIVTFGLGYNLGERRVMNDMAKSVFSNVDKDAAEKVDFSPFWKAWSVIDKDYVPTGTTTKVATTQERLWGAIEGMVASLDDPYTVFFPPEESKQFASEIKGSFGGVGMEMGQEDGIITVISPLKDSPAERAGLKAKDRIIKVDGKDITRSSTDEAVSLIRGPEGTSVTLTVLRTGKAPFDVTIVRQVINIPVIKSESLGEGIFKISLYSFTENSAALFRTALREFIESEDTKLILDVRGNPGGYLESALDMASWFLPSGMPVIREDHGKGDEERVYRSRGYDIFSDELKMVVLVNGGSASASEILAGALSDYKKATIIGEKTFGKGSVQELVPITSDTSLKVTIARWLTPSGRSISEEGITPDIEVKQTDEDIKLGRDAQLDRAIEFLKTGK